MLAAPIMYSSEYIYIYIYIFTYQLALHVGIKYAVCLNYNIQYGDAFSVVLQRGKPIHFTSYRILSTDAMLARILPVMFQFTKNSSLWSLRYALSQQL